MYWLITIAILLAQILVAEQAAELRLNTDQAKAVLSFATGEQPWNSVASTEGYSRLKQREAIIGSTMDDDAFRSFVLAESLRMQLPKLRATLVRWAQVDVNTVARHVSAYLPAEAKLSATVYLVVKPKHNNFVFEASTRPAIFISLDPSVNPKDFENTIAHESHHIGLASLTVANERAYATLAQGPRAAAEWLGAFGEGVAMLAAAGGPDIHPHEYSPAADRARWDAAMLRVEADMRTTEKFLLDVVNGRLNKAQQREAGMALFDVQGPWYTVGWFMASHVERELGRPALVACMPDFRMLLLRFNEVAEPRKLPRWSTELLRKIENR